MLRLEVYCTAMAVNSIFICVCVVSIILPSPTSAVFVKSVKKPSGLTFLKGDLLSRNGRKCHDFCISGWCLNGGTCITEETTCVGSCVCTMLWRGPRCNESAILPRFLSSILDAITNSSESDVPLREFQHNTNQKIIKNRKLLNGFHNVLTEIGHLNGIKEVITHPGDDVNDNMSHQVALPSSPKPSNEETAVPTSRFNAAIPSSPSYYQCINSCTEGVCTKVKDTYKCTNKPTKVCGPGFVCIHGECDLEAKENNSYGCICEGNYRGQFCNIECPLDCGKYGYCDIDVSESSYKCFCQWNYTGYNCSELIPPETELLNTNKRILFHWYILGASVSIVILILTGTVLVGYFLWKRRLVFVLKIVHFFQEYEDDDGKEFDAFVSYKSTERDEKFVLTELFPRLEGTSKFKLCLHFRDFEPGEAIANNIVRAIENSRRTIMILSPAYVKSEWCRMEYQKAQHEMLKLKHKIIPIVLEDISDMKNVDKNLKSILDSVTYMEWPGPESNEKKVERFWTKLELSLPKKSTPNSSSSSTTTPSSSSSASSIQSPLSDSTTISDSISPPTSSNKQPSLTISIPSETSSGQSQMSSIKCPSSPKTYQRRRKNFKHFINRFVCNKLKFNRQDSNSSQMALVDEETAGSRSSCDSVSESNLTESTESMCSTPVTTHGFLDETDNETREASSYFSISKESTTIKENKVGVCEKDHCEGVECTTCLSLAGRKDPHKGMKESDMANVQNENGNEDHDIDAHPDKCELCKLEQQGSDNNRVKISVIEGSDQVRIQRLPCVHKKYKQSFERNSIYKGSLKKRKEAVNRELSALNRAGTLPRNFQSRILAKRVPELGDSIYSDDGFRTTSCEPGRGDIADHSQVTHDKNHTYCVDTDLDASMRKSQCYIDICESI